MENEGGSAHPWALEFEVLFLIFIEPWWERTWSKRD